MNILKKILDKTPIICLTLIFSVLIIGKSYIYLFDPDNKHTYFVSPVSVARAEAEKEMPIRLFAMNLAYENGIDPNLMDCVLKNESGYNPNAYNVNKNGTVDLGIAQWSSQHIKSGFISLECVSSPTCAIKRMVEKVKADKGFKAWLAVSKCK